MSKTTEAPAKVSRKAKNAELLEQAVSFMRKERKGSPTHNRYIAAGIGIKDEQGYDQLYAAMKADAESESPRFVFRPDGLPAAFALTPSAKRQPRAKAKA